MGVHTGSSAVSPHRVYWRGGGDLLSLVGEGESRRDDLEAAIDDLHARSRLSCLSGPPFRQPRTGAESASSFFSV